MIQQKIVYFGRQAIQLKKNQNKELKMFLKGKNREISKFLLDPQGKFKRNWDIMMVVILLYLATFAPYKVAFMI